MSVYLLVLENNRDDNKRELNNLGHMIIRSFINEMPVDSIAVCAPEEPSIAVCKLFEEKNHKTIIDYNFGQLHLIKPRTGLQYSLNHVEYCTELAVPVDNLPESLENVKSRVLARLHHYQNRKENFCLVMDLQIANIIASHFEVSIKNPNVASCWEVCDTTLIRSKMKLSNTDNLLNCIPKIEEEIEKPSIKNKTDLKEQVFFNQVLEFVNQNLDTYNVSSSKLKETTQQLENSSQKNHENLINMKQNLKMCDLMDSIRQSVTEIAQISSNLSQCAGTEELTEQEIPLPVQIKKIQLTQNCFYQVQISNISTRTLYDVHLMSAEPGIYETISLLKPCTEEIIEVYIPPEIFIAKRILEIFASVDNRMVSEIYEFPLCSLSVKKTDSQIPQIKIKNNSTIALDCFLYKNSEADHIQLSSGSSIMKALQIQSPTNIEIHAYGGRASNSILIS